MKYEFEIYQTEAMYAFMEYDFAKENGFNQSDYEFCCGSTLEATCEEEVLEIIWGIFNAEDRPFRREMRSLSVSDVVVINGKAYYCDPFGWYEINWRRDWQ